MLAVIGRSASYPMEQWSRAREVADHFGVPVLELDTDELSDPRYTANPSNRCYFCKSELWSRLVPLARERGLAVVIDGTNADDGRGHRPGKGAAAEQGVRSPLAELGFTKDEIRELSRARGIPTWSQPSSPCLASRLPYGTEVTAERLAKVEIAERGLRAIGVTGDLRVRYYGNTARLELSLAELARWRTADGRRAVHAVVTAAGFDAVEFDLRGFRSGSMNHMHEPALVESLGVGLMFGCIGRLGCLLVLAAAAAIGWFTRDSWYPKLRARIGATPPVVVAAEAKWEPLTPEGSARARLAVGKLSSRDGPVYVDVAAGDLAAYALEPSLRLLSRDSAGAEALARDDHLYVRAMVNVADLVDAKSLGPLTSMIGGRQEVTVRGRLEVVSPGHAQFLVDQVALKDLQLPAALVDEIVARIRPNDRNAATPKDAIPVSVPRELADVRVAKGHVVLYKSVP